MRERVLADCCEAFLAVRYLTRNRTLASLNAPIKMLIDPNKNWLVESMSLPFFNQDSPNFYAQDFSGSDTEESDEHISSDERSNYSFATNAVIGLALLGGLAATAYGVNKHVTNQQKLKCKVKESRSDESDEGCRLM